VHDDDVDITPLLSIQNATPGGSGDGEDCDCVEHGNTHARLYDNAQSDDDEDDPVDTLETILGHMSQCEDVGYNDDGVEVSLGVGVGAVVGKIGPAIGVRRPISREMEKNTLGTLVRLLLRAARGEILQIGHWRIGFNVGFGRGLPIPPLGTGHALPARFCIRNIRSRVVTEFRFLVYRMVIIDNCFQVSLFCRIRRWTTCLFSHAAAAAVAATVSMISLCDFV